MKAKITENNEDVVYVQKKDLKLLNQLLDEMPVSIYFRIADNGITCYNSEEYEFIDLSEREEILFLNATDWIMDYNQIIQLSKEEMESLIESIQDKLKNIQSSCIDLSNYKESKKKEKMIQKQLLQNQLEDLIEILNIKMGKHPVLDFLKDFEEKARVPIEFSEKAPQSPFSNKIKSLFIKDKNRHVS